MRDMINELKKKWRRRVILWLSGLIILLFLDEYIKEGYLFNPNDIWNWNITHEKIILILFLFLIYLLLGR